VLLWEHTNGQFAYKKTLKVYKYPVVHIVFVENGIAITTDDAIIHIWDLGLTTSLRSLDLSHLPFKLHSLKIKNIVYTKRHLLLNTYSGDFIRVGVEMRKELKKKTFVYEVDGKRYRNIVKLNGRLTCSLYMEAKSDERSSASIMVGSESSAVSNISIGTRELIEISSVGDPILCMDGISFANGGMLSAYGTSKGRVLVKLDWETSPNTFNANSPILCLKLTRDCHHLVLASQNGIVYLFTNHSKSFFHTSPKQ
jgi:hypothetical protein